MRRSLLAFALAVCLCPALAAFSIMSYNVENLFDGVHDGTEFREFDPARGTWSEEMFQVRVTSLAEVIRKAVPGGPDVLLFQEIENKNALDGLVGTGLRGMGYRWSVIVPKKNLTANVAIVSRLPIVRVRTHYVPPWKGAGIVRDVLEAEIAVNGHTLYVLDNHWKSKTEGPKQTEPSRRAAASVLARRIEEILASDPAADIVAAGDMNESFDEYRRIGERYPTALMPFSSTSPGSPGTILLGAGGTAGAGVVLYEPWYELDQVQGGSYAYQGEWLTVDHMLLSAGMFDTRGFSYRRGSFSPVRQPFLLDPAGLPRRWDGTSGARGLSDHLPIILSIDLH